MPQLLKHIDAIAREKKRTALYLEFYDPRVRVPYERVDEWKSNENRQLILDWLNQNRYEWIKCGQFANPHLMMPYVGTVYIDVPCDNNLPEYRKLEAFLQNPDETMKFPDVYFCAMPLKNAMKNVEHDDPDFWDSWAENF